jgi:hypothetical protein
MSARHFCLWRNGKGPGCSAANHVAECQGAWSIPREGDSPVPIIVKLMEAAFINMRQQEWQIVILHKPEIIEEYTGNRYWGNSTLLERFAANCVAHPDREAVVDPPQPR